MCIDLIGGSRGTRDARPSSGSKFLHFHAVFGKIGQITGSRPSRVGAPTSGKSLFSHWTHWTNFESRVSLNASKYFGSEIFL